MFREMFSGTFRVHDTAAVIFFNGTEVVKPEWPIMSRIRHQPSHFDDERRLIRPQPGDFGKKQATTILPLSIP